MKKILFLFLLFGLLNTQADAQGMKDVKKAAKNLGLFRLDPQANGDKIKEAKNLIDAASSSEEVQSEYKYWFTRGEIYNELATKESNMTAVNPNYTVKDRTLGIVALEGFRKALSLADKKYKKKDVLAVLPECANSLNNFGYQAFSAKDFMSAYRCFNAVIGVNKLLQDNGAEGIFQNDNDRLNGIYLAGLSASQTGGKADCIPYYEQLRTAGLEGDEEKGPAVYIGLYNAYSEKDPEKAEEVLIEGRKLFPNETSMLFQEINLYLRKGKLAELIGKMELALEKEPDNISLYTTFGNVYDRLREKKMEEGDEKGANEYEDKAMNYYEQALAKDSDNFIANYSIGALYYNQAAKLSKEMNALANDYSKAGTQKYNAKKAEMESFFDKALPYFEKADAANPNDLSTLNALKEINARKDNFDKSKEYKQRIEALQK